MAGAAFFVVTAAAAAFLWTGGRKREGAPPAVSPPAPAPADGTAGIRAAAPLAGAPSWVNEAPHFFKRGGRTFASAVGRARIADLPLARSAAQDRARADLLRLLQGKTATGRVEGELRGARVTDSYQSKKDGVFVRLEIETADPASGISAPGRTVAATAR
jgi:hypothetical protein